MRNSPDDIDSSPLIIPTISAVVEASNKSSANVCQVPSLETDAQGQQLDGNDSEGFTNESEVDECLIKTDDSNGNEKISISAAVQKDGARMEHELNLRGNNSEKNLRRLSPDSKCDLSDKNNVDVTTPLLNNTYLDEAIISAKATSHPSNVTSRNCSQEASGSLFRNRPGSILSIFNTNPKKDQVPVISPSHQRLYQSSSSPLPSPSISSSSNSNHHQHYLHHYPLHIQKPTNSYNQTKFKRIEESTNQNSSPSNSVNNCRLTSTSSSSSGSLAQSYDFNISSIVSPYDAYLGNKKQQKMNAAETSIEMTQTLTRTISSTSNDTGYVMSTSEVSNVDSDPSNLESSQSSSPIDVLLQGVSMNFSKKAPHSVLSVEDESKDNVKDSVIHVDESEHKSES